MDESTNNMVMPVAPMYGGNYGGNNGFGFGGDWSWILLLILLCGGGWGGFGGFGGMGGWGGMMNYGVEFPWLLNGQNQINANTNSGFDHAATQNALGNIQNAITGGFGDVQNSLCSGFAGVNATVNGAQNALAQQLYTNQISDLERSFAAQTASTQGMTALQSQLAQCCCDNRLASESLRATVLSENCTDRAALSDGIRDIITNQTANTQRILDQLCSDKIDAKNDEIAQLRQEVLYARGQASQVAQNQQIVDSIYNRLDTCPVGTTPVYGRTPIFTCNNGCGCSGNSGFVG